MLCMNFNQSNVLGKLSYILKTTCEACDTLSLRVSLLLVNSGRNNRAQHMNRLWIARTCNITVLAGLWILVLLELLNIFEASKLYCNCLAYKVINPDCIKKEASFCLFLVDLWPCVRERSQTQLPPQFLLSDTHKEYKWVILALVAIQCLPTISVYSNYGGYQSTESWSLSDQLFRDAGYFFFFNLGFPQGSCIGYSF